VEYVVVGDRGDTGLLNAAGRCTESHVVFDSVGDVVLIFGGRTRSCDRGCLIAKPHQ
jgi:hypothetical protein